METVWSIICAIVFLYMLIKGRIITSVYLVGTKMAFQLSAVEIKSLANMLCPNDDSDSGDELPQCGTGKLGPGNVGPPRRSQQTKGNKSEPKKEVDPNAIWNEEEVPEAEVCDDSIDPRQRPKYEVKYRQSVSPEDIYLQMGNKTTATASCEDLAVTIELPGEEQRKVDLEVTKERLDIRSPLFRLHLPLPHPVDPDSSRAEWNAHNSTLTVILRMQREYDYVNF